MNGVFTNSCSYIFGSYKKCNYTRKDCKPWFDFECKRKRKLFHQAKKTYDRNVNGENRSNL